jgi:hypothetical protein
MKKSDSLQVYLFSGKAKFAILLVVVLWIAFSSPGLLGGEVQVDNFLRPYSTGLLVLIFCLWFFRIKRKNWKSSVRVATLFAVLTMMIFVTSIQLAMLHNTQLAVETADIFLRYRLGQVLIYDILGIFAFFAVSATVNKMSEG